jgi:hypothetical protein
MIISSAFNQYYSAFIIFLIYGYACFILDRMQPCHLPTLEIMMPLMLFLMRLSLQSMLGVLLITFT